MSLDQLKDSLPGYAKDIKLNLSNIAGDETLTAQQLWGTMMACALAGRNDDVIAAIAAEASAHLSPEAMEAAKAAASIMAMNNVYYKFVGTMGGDYATMPAKLRMNIIANPGVDKVDFELWSLAVSAINGCQYCVKAHEKMLVDAGMSRAEIQMAVRTASVIQAVSAIIDGERAMDGATMKEAA